MNTKSRVVMWLWGFMVGVYLTLGLEGTVHCTFNLTMAALGVVATVVMIVVSRQD